MALPSFLKRKDPAGAQPAPRGGGVDVQHARVRARRRLIGAAVLLGVGVIAFPLIFETQPRPIPVDLPIEIPRKDAVDPLPAPPRAAKPAAVTAVAPPAGAVVEPAAAAPSAASTSTPAPKADAAPAPGVAASVPAAGRYVVQVGAFADATATREARLKVERLGLKTYTQVVDTDNGKRTRVRIGPFESRDEASRALATLKAANLPGAVLAL